MTDHLPECYKEGSTDSCICDELRACEQRVREQNARAFDVAVIKHLLQEERAAALDAAREAVLGVSVYRWPYSEPSDEYTECITVDSALAAIDALRGES